jgi:hypothetical protein
MIDTITLRSSARIIRDDLMAIENMVLTRGEDDGYVSLLATAEDYRNIASGIPEFHEWGKIPLPRRKFIDYKFRESNTIEQRDSLLRSIDAARAVLAGFEE